MIEYLLFPAVALIVAVIAAFAYVFKTRPGQDGTPPGPMGIPFLGYIPFLGSYPWIGLEKLRDKYPKLVALYMGKDYTVVLQDYEAVEAALIKQDEMYRGRPEAFLLRYFQSGRDGEVHGVLFLEGPKWEATHAYLRETLRDDLGAYTRKMDDICVEECQKMMQRFLEQRGAFVPDDLIYHAKMNAMGRLMFGRPLSDAEFDRITKHDDTAFAQLAGGVVTMYPWTRFIPGPTMKGWTDVQYAVEQRFQLMEKELAEHTATYQQGVIRDFMDAYLRHIKEGDNKDQLAMQNNDDLMCTAAAAFAAGSEATTVSLLWGVLYLVAHPEVQKKVHEELDRVIGRSRAVHYDDIDNLPYTAATVYEYLRLGGSAPLGNPRSTFEETELLGYRIPKRTQILPNLHAINRNPQYYDDPLSFKPERFIGPDGEVHLPKQFMPFSVGTRFCPGVDAAKTLTFTFFANMMHKLDIRSAKGQDLPPFDEYRVGISSRPLEFKIEAVERGTGF
ncbi:cytochrome P450 2J6-like [Paramacrobiotus metropolitanus]|uniref:cytochrome P450 2J6-like n=1 Tax=Paramacrobiotus metropolitanus TaxID=2943436 RepID=UPI0024457951|nr:cytochrome P450 2J6-like [Paramacrobiotus metropolitanus]